MQKARLPLKWPERAFLLSLAGLTELNQSRAAERLINREKAQTAPFKHGTHNSSDCITYAKRADMGTSSPYPNILESGRTSCTPLSTT